MSSKAANEAEYLRTTSDGSLILPRGRATPSTTKAQKTEVQISCFHSISLSISQSYKQMPSAQSHKKTRAIQSSLHVGDHVMPIYHKNKDPAEQLQSMESFAGLVISYIYIHIYGCSRTHRLQFLNCPSSVN